MSQFVPYERKQKKTTILPTGPGSVDSNQQCLNRTPLHE
jgi:hypothetical protein